MVVRPPGRPRSRRDCGGPGRCAAGASCTSRPATEDARTRHWPSSWESRRVRPPPPSPHPHRGAAEDRRLAHRLLQPAPSALRPRPAIRHRVRTIREPRPGCPGRVTTPSTIPGIDGQRSRTPPGSRAHTSLRSTPSSPASWSLAAYTRPCSEPVYDLDGSAKPGTAPSAILSRVQTFMLMTIPTISRISSCKKCSASASCRAPKSSATVASATRVSASV